MVRHLTGLSNSTIDRAEKKGDFPKRVELGRRAKGWFEDEVDQYLADLRAARDGKAGPD
jgi:prophage regulatory protein